MEVPTTADPGYTAENYFDLIRSGAIDEQDRVELLEGLVVASPQQGPLHAAALSAVDSVLRRAIGDRATVRVQMPLRAGQRSVPEPDLAVVVGNPYDYAQAHPADALLVIEVADSSLPQDRLTKSRIYAAAGIPEYWIVNLRERCVEVLTGPDRERRVYAQSRRAGRGDVITLAAMPEVSVGAAGMLPAY